MHRSFFTTVLVGLIAIVGVLGTAYAQDEPPLHPERFITIDLKSPNAQTMKDVYVQILRSAGVYDLTLASQEQLEKLEEMFIGCDQCHFLDSAEPPGALQFIVYREHFGNYWLVTNAISGVIKNSNAVTYTVTYPAAQVGACPNPVPPNCANRAACLLTDQCDGNVNLKGCQVCPAP